MIDSATFADALRPLLRQSAGYALSLLRDRGEAEEAVQQAALRAWERRRQFDERQSFRAWWYAILRNTCRDELRRRMRRPAHLDVEGLELPSGQGEVDHDRMVLASAIARLAPQHGEIIGLRYFGELSYQELARILEIPEGTVMSRLHLARKALGTMFQTEAP